jgi:outer membrane receptor protein involved in Fe transport
VMHIRGEHANVQYRINGILLPDTINGFGQVVPTSIIDRIELIDGALPAQYGFRTAGIIDIQTKSGAFNPGGSVDVYGGTNGTIQPSFDYGGSAGSFNYFVTGSNLSSNQGIEGPTAAYQPLHDHTEQSKGFGYFSWLLNPTNRLNLVVGSSVSLFQVPNNPNQATCGWTSTTPCNPVINGNPAASKSSASLNINQKEENYFATLALQGTNGDYDYQLAPYARQSSLHYVPDQIGELEFDGVAADVLRTNLATGLQGDVGYRANASHTVRSGFLAQNEQAVNNSTQTVFQVNPDGTLASNVPVSITDNHSKSANLYGVYVQDEWRLNTDLTMNYGARYDVSDAYRYETQASPRLGFVYKASTITTLHAGYAKTFTPPPVELIAPSSIAKFNGTSQQPGVTQDDLVKSESADDYDVGVIFKFTNEYTLGWDNYYKDVQHLLDEGQFGPALVLTPFNYRKGYIYGSELSQSYVTPRIDSYLNLAYSVAMGTQIESAQFNFSPDELAYIQNHYIHLDHDQTYTASAGISYLVMTDTRIGVDGLYGSGLRNGFANTTHLPDYGVINFVVKQHLHMVDAKGVDVRFVVQNVFDESYELRDGTGVGVGAPQFGPRAGYYAGITKPF